MHRQQSRIIVLEIDETVIGIFSGVPVFHHFDCYDSVLTHGVEGAPEKRLVHVGLQLQKIGNNIKINYDSNKVKISINVGIVFSAEDFKLLELNCHC